MATRRRERRDKYAIGATIIETSLEPVLMTDIVYNTRLNFKLARKYLDHFIKNGLISFDLKTKTYKSEEKGKEFLELFYRVRELYGE